MKKKTKNLEVNQTKEAAEQHKNEEKVRKLESLKSKYNFNTLLRVFSRLCTEVLSLFTIFIIVVVSYIIATRLYYASNWIDIAVAAIGCGVILVFVNINNQIRY